MCSECKSENLKKRKFCWCICKSSKYIWIFVPLKKRLSVQNFERNFGLPGPALKHMNYFELLAHLFALVAVTALQCFHETASSTSVEIQVDITLAVSFINRLGGSKSKKLCEIALKIPHWCEIRNLSLTAGLTCWLTQSRGDLLRRETGNWILRHST